MIYEPGTILRCKVDNLVAWKSWAAIDFVPIPTDRNLELISEGKEFNLRFNKVVYTLKLRFYIDEERAFETRRVFLNVDIVEEEAQKYFIAVPKPERVIHLLPPTSGK